MIRFLMKKYALSRQGAKDLITATIACAVHNFTLMLPVSLLYFLVSDLMGGGVPQGHLWFYLAGMAAGVETPQTAAVLLRQARPERSHHDDHGGLHDARTVLFALDPRIFRVDALHVRRGGRSVCL